MSRRPLLVGLPVALVASLLTGQALANSGPPAPLTITTVSDRADLISGGDALLRIDATDGLRLELNGRDVTAEFDRHSDGHGLGLLTGLRLGANELKASVADGRGAELTITNHPLGGPVFAGPQIQPWACPAGSLDRQCDARPTVAYYYLPTGAPRANPGATGTATANALQPYDPASPPPPGAVAQTTTTDGVTVPFIVRQETGYIDRDQYAIATLWQPGHPWTGWAPQRQFNHRLVITHGASCDTTYGSGTAPSVLDPVVLGGGFLVMSNALDNAGHNCDLVTQAESLVMTKEYAIDHYGTVRYTIGMGCSGGSLVQQQVANAYPGIYQGIIPQCSFTDAWSSAMEYVDYDMLLRYFKDPSRWSPGTVWTPAQISAVIDHPNVGNPVTFTTVIPNSANPSRSCPDVPASEVYNPRTNPAGVKCTLQDYMVNVFGRRPDGFANRPFGNAGIQYGLQALLDGVISPGQFVDLNTHLGGLDYQDNVQPARSTPDLVGLARAYTTGAVDEANNLNQVAIIDLRGPDPGFFHDVYRTYAMRDRLLRDFGTAANQVLWQGQSPIIGDQTFVDDAVYAMDTWLARVYDDRRPLPLPRKIIVDKPATLTNRCTDGDGHALPFYVCEATVASYGTPRFAAGEPETDDVLQCQLKPLRVTGYPVTFDAAQWAALRRAFPHGVCDYTKPGVDQRPTLPWLTYSDAAGHVVYGGTPMGPAPHSVPLHF